MARIDSFLHNMNPRVSTAQETAKKLNIDQNLIEKAAQKLGVDILTDPACKNYFKTMGQNLQVLCTRHWEIEYKSDLGRVDEPRKFTQAFLSRDTSQKAMYQDRLPNIDEKLISRWEQIGFLKPEQLDAMRSFFLNPPPSSQGVGAEVDPEYSQFFENFGQQEENVSPHQTRHANPIPQQVATHQSGTSQTHSISRSLSRNTSHVPAPPSHPGSSPTGGGNGLGITSANTTQSDYDFLNRYFSPNDPGYGLLGSMIGDVSRASDLMGSYLNKMREGDQMKQNIMAELAGIDPTTPEGAKQMFQAQYALNEQSTSSRTLMENIQTIMRSQAERVEMTNKILDIQNQTLKQISSKIN